MTRSLHCSVALIRSGVDLLTSRSAASNRSSVRLAIDSSDLQSLASGRAVDSKKAVCLVAVL